MADNQLGYRANLKAIKTVKTKHYDTKTMLNGLIQFITFQIIQVNQTTPCFLNQSASGIQILRNCGLGTDYLKAMTLGFDWVTGGYFSLILVSLFVMMTYIKYHKPMYPILIGLLYIPVAYTILPTEFLIYALILTGATIAIMVVVVFVKQTKEYDG